MIQLTTTFQKVFAANVTAAPVVMAARNWRVFRSTDTF